VADDPLRSGLTGQSLDLPPKGRLNVDRMDAPLFESLSRVARVERFRQDAPLLIVAMLDK
jgi:hypothetical protein